MSTLGTTVEAGTGLQDPTLAFGLTKISDSSTQRAFLDLMKESRPFVAHDKTSWSAMTNDALAAGGYLDADGWPTEIPAGMSGVGTVWAWSNSQADTAAATSRSGVYVLTYEGEGTLKLSGDMKILSSEPGRIVVQNVTGGTMQLDITATDPSHTGDYIRNISLVPQKYEALHEMGEIFNPEWLAVIQDARQLRFMDWMKTNGATSATWDDRAHVSNASYMADGVPLEVMVQLANQTGVEPWFNMPAGASEDYIRNFATYVRDNLNPDLKIHVEYSNETWNFLFDQTDWLLEQAKTVWGSTDKSAYIDYNAMLATKSALIWDQVFGSGADARVDNVLGIQTGSVSNAERLLTGSLWQKLDPAGYVAPSAVFDSLAVTTYFGNKTLTDTAMRDDLLAHIRANPTTAMTWLTAKLMDPTYSGSIPLVIQRWEASKTVADKYGLDFVAYEGGQHLLQSFGIGGMTAADQTLLTSFLSEYARSEGMATLYHTLWIAWSKLSDGPFMQFNDVDAVSKSGAWGLFTALGDNSPRAELLMDLNAHSTSWFGDGGGERYQQGVIKVAADTGEALVGTNKDDFLIGGRGADTITAGMGHDAISGGMGRDVLVLSGAAEDYTLVAEGDGYRLTGPGASHYVRGIDMFRFEDDISVSLTDMLSLEDTTGKALAGTTAADMLVGGAGNDTITGSLGADTIIGGDGNDVLILSGTVSDYTLLAEGTGYRLTGAGISDFLQGIEQFRFDGNIVKSLNDVLTQVVIDPGPLHLAARGAQVDSIDVAQVQVDGTEGVTIRGIVPLSALGLQLGIDANSELADYVLATNTATATFGTSVVAQSFWSLLENQASFFRPAPLSADALTTALKLGSIATSVHSIVATAADDHFFGVSRNDNVDGAGGNDELYGRRGNDTLYGGAGDDTITGGQGNDVMTGGTGRDRFYISTGQDHDRIIDFGSDDVLDLVGKNITSHDALMAMVSEDASGNLVIGDAADSITLVGLHTSDLSWMSITI